MLFGFLLIAAGYAGVYYGIDVLVWAHFSTSTNEPVPFSACLGLPGTRKSPFMPPLTLGIQIPGAITDARGLLGGVATTGQYLQATDGLAKAGNFLNVTPGGVPTGTAAGGSAPGPAGPVGGGASSPSFNIGSLEDPATRPRPPGFIGPVAVNPAGTGATHNAVGQPVNPFGTPAANGRPATGVYRQGNMQQNQDGTWSRVG